VRKVPAPVQSPGVSNTHPEDQVETAETLVGV
jgi:hypothetical protein